MASLNLTECNMIVILYVLFLPGSNISSILVFQGYHCIILDTIDAKISVSHQGDSKNLLNIVDREPIGNLTTVGTS